MLFFSLWGVCLTINIFSTWCIFIILKIIGYFSRANSVIKQPQWLLLPVWLDKFWSVQYIGPISALMYCLEYKHFIFSVIIFVLWS